MAPILVCLVLVCLFFAIYWLFSSEKSQLFGKFPWHAEVKDKLVALTFDDGPNPPYTLQIADFLKAKQVKATFFEVGNCVRKYPEVTKRLAQDGHVIGNHSLSHTFHSYFINPSFEQQITTTQAIIKKAMGMEPALFRPPWLWRSPLLFKTLKRYSLQPVSGNFCHRLEVFHISGIKIAKRVIAKTQPGSIIIFHDGYNAKGAVRSQTVQAVKIVVDELSNQGYKFITVDKLLDIPAYH